MMLAILYQIRAVVNLSIMPAFQETLIKAQMIAILEFIKSAWSREQHVM
jgi:hypothetical protein